MNDSVAVVEADKIVATIKKGSINSHLVLPPVWGDADDNESQQIQQVNILH